MRTFTFAALLFCVGCSGDSSRVTKSASSSSPEDTYKSMEDAVRKEDWSTFFDCWTPQGQDYQLGTLVLWLASEKDKLAIEKSGLDKKEIARIVALEVQTFDQLMMFAKLVKNKKEFFVENMHMQYRAQWKQIVDNTDLVDVTVADDTASGNLRFDSGEDVIHFQRTGDLWRIDTPPPNADD